MKTAWLVGSPVAAAELKALLDDSSAALTRCFDGASALPAALEDRPPDLVFVEAQRFDAAIVWPSRTAVVLIGPPDLARADAFLERPFDRRHLALAIEVALLRAEVRATQLAQLTIDRAVDGFHLVDRHARFISANDAATRILGYSRAELLTMTVHDIDPAFPKEAWGPHWEDLLRRTSFSFESSVVRKDGREVPVEITVNHLRFEGEDYNCASMRDITDRKRAERALRASERRHRRLFEEAIEGIFNASADGTLLEVTPAFARLLGYASPGELVGASVAALYVDPDERKRHEAEACSFKVRWRKKDGTVVFVELQGSVVRTSEGAFSHYQGFVRDVTDQVADEDAMQFLSTELSRHSGSALFEEAARRLAAIVGAEIGFVVAFQAGGSAPSGRVLGMALEGASVAPYTYPLSGTPCETVYLRGRPTTFARGVQAAFPTDEELVRLGVEGYASAPFLDRHGVVIGHVGAMTRAPIAHPSRVEAVLRRFALRLGGELERQREEARFFGVFEFATSALLVLDEAERVILANRTAEAMWRRSREALLGAHLTELLSPASDAAPSTALGHWAVRMDGTRLPVELSTSPLEAEGRRLTVASVQDVSARTAARREVARLEEQLRQSQRLESLGTLAGGIAHDFNNLLAAILSSVEDVRDDAGTEPVRVALAEIDTAANRAAALVKQILAFSRRAPTHASVTAVGPIVEEVVRMLRALLPSSVRVELALESSDLHALVDATQLHRVLMNLGTNAGHAIGERRGAITYRLSSVDVDASPPVAGMPSGAWVCLRVEDDGTGMPASVRERVFEPFFTTKGTGRGTGLGLSVAHGIVAEHGGSITVESEPGKGSAFTVYLPAVAAPAASLRVPAPSPKPAKGAGRLLLVDDEPALVRVGKRLMEKLGYEVVGFVDPVLALEAFHADPSAFDLIVTDQNMPSLTGLEVAHAVHRLRPELPVLLVSGNATVSDSDLAQAGIPHRLEKPFALEELSRVLHRTLGPR